MGRKKLAVCNLVFDENQMLEEKIIQMFSPENIISCFSEKHLDEYKKVIDHTNIQMILNDADLMKTIYAFFENNLNSSVTSEKTFMHRNTLNYRLDKVRKYTGLCLKGFEHAVVFKNLIIISEIIKSLNG